MNSPAPDLNDPQPMPGNPNPEPARPPAPPETPQPNEPPGVPPPSPNPIPSPDKKPIQIPHETPPEVPSEPSYPAPTAFRMLDLTAAALLCWTGIVGFAAALEDCDGVLTPPKTGDEEVEEPASDAGTTPVIRPDTVPEQPPD